jgi:phage baseplate assembly protein W
MNVPRYRAWRFLHPDIEASEGDAGLGLSLRGGIDMVDEHAAVRQAILLLFSTIPGERVMRPDYGCDLYKLVFAPNDDTTAGLAIHYVQQALSRWEPRIQLLHLDAGSNATDPGRLDIILAYRLQATQHNEELVFSMSLAGEQT